MRRVSCIALLVLLAGCGSVPRTHYYVLEAQSAATNRAVQGLSVGVRMFAVEPPFDQDRVVYRPRSGQPEVGFYAYHRWAAPLARMVPTAVAHGMAGVAGASRVEPATNGRDYERYLDGNVLRVEEVDRDGGVAAAHVSLVLTLRTASGDTLWSEIVHGEAETSTNEVADVVVALRGALEKAIAAARPGLAAALQTPVSP